MTAILKFIFLYDSGCIFTKISVKIVPKIAMNNIGSDKGFVPKKRQAIIWGNGALVTDADIHHLASVS